MLVGSIICLIILIILITIALVFGVLKSHFVSKTNAIYFIPLLCINVVLYSMGLIYSKNSYDIISFFDCLVCGIKSFAFEIKTEYLSSLMKDNKVFNIDIIMATILSGLTMISTLIDFIKEALSNYFSVFYRVFFKKIDIVIGSEEEGYIFAKNNNKTIYLFETDDFEKENVKQQKKKFYGANIAYLQCKSLSKTLKKILWLNKKDIHIFVFDNGIEKLNRTLDLIHKIHSTKQEIHLHVMSNQDNILFVNKMLTQACNNSNNRNKIIASAFNIHDLIGRNFTKQYTFAQFLPRDFIDNGTIKPEKDIHVVMLGAGKCSNSVLKASILDNQFIEKYLENGQEKFRAKPIHYHLYDSANNAVFNNRIVSLFSNTAFTNLEIEQTATIETTPNINVLQEMEIETFDPNNSFIFYFVSVGNTMHNITIANHLAQHLKNRTHSIIFYCIDSDKEKISNEFMNCSDIKILPFGFKNDMLTREKIFDNKLYEGAKSVNNLYNDRKKGNISFTEHDIVDKLSNLYGDLNIEFKLNMLGFTLKDTAINGEKRNQATFKEFDNAYLSNCTYHYDQNNIKLNYKDYFKINTLTALIYQERLRWTTYYYINGFETMPLSEIKTIEKKNSSEEIEYTCIHKDIPHRKHACLTSFDRLDKMHRYEANLLYTLNQRTFDEELSNVETFKYDCMNLNKISESRSTKIYKLNEF